jgi:predicted nucleic acid-binding Zn ribbon protein
MHRAGKIIAGLDVPGASISAEESTLNAWAAAVGKRLANRTRAVALAHGRLTVEVEDAIWQHQLETLSGQILKKLNALAGNPKVERIEFRIGIPRRQPQRAEQAGIPSDEADGISDPGLRRVYRIARRKALA